MTRHRHGATLAARLTRALDPITGLDVEQLTANAWEWTAGIPAATTEPRVATSADPALPIRLDHNGNPASDGPDWKTLWDRQLAATIRELERLHRLAADLTRPTTPPVERTATIADCQACGRTVACTHADPLRRGCCTTCDTWIRRTAAQRRDDDLRPLDHTELVRLRATHLTETQQPA